MTARISPKGIVGLGALGRAIDSLIPDQNRPAAVFFTVKAFDLEIALLQQADQWPESLPFITLCNGYIWPIIENIYPHLGRRPIRVGMTTIGSTIQDNGTILIFSTNTSTAWGHWPDSNIPAITPDQRELELLKNFPGGHWYDDIRPMIRRKWIYNVVINSVAAALKLKKNGLLLNYRAEVETATIEAIELSNKLWQNLPFATLDNSKIPEQIWQVIQATAGNQNSMVRDLLLGRRTESDYLAGLAMHYDGFPTLKRLHGIIVSSNS